MGKRIEDYAFVGNMLTGALVGNDGSIDWLCLPHFDDDPCFAALLGTEQHGHWRIAPGSEILSVSRQYRSGTAILETSFTTPKGSVTLIDFMPFSDDERYVDVVRILRGDSGEVEVAMDLVIRTGFGRVVPWVRRRDFGISAVAGPDAIELHTPLKLSGADFRTTARVNMAAGDRIPFRLAWHPSHLASRAPAEPDSDLDETARRWREWSGRCCYERGTDHPWHRAVRRSLITLKAMTFSPTGGMVAAPTTSLPEKIGGVRNWDYRFCWIRDATLAIYSLLSSGYPDEARAWRRWLLRAVAGEPRQLQILYGLDGERRHPEIEISWLPGYENSRPVRLGNAACEQLQLDVPGELMDLLHTAREFDLEVDEDAWALQCAMLDRLEDDWDQPDEGIWEVRGGRMHFTFSRLMCWVAFDRAVSDAERYALPGPVERWRMLRDRIREDIEANGWSERKQSFVQSYGAEALDASLLLMAEVGFLKPTDRRFKATVAAIERELVVDRLVLRYRPEETPDGMAETEGAFLACSFWLVDAYVLLGRHDEAEALFEHLLSLRNDVGLLAEEYDPADGRQLGNFPQAFSHISLINTAFNLASAHGPAKQRAGMARGLQRSLRRGDGNGFEEVDRGKQRTSRSDR